METLEILDKLIAFPTVSSEPNRALIDYCASSLKDAGADIKIIEDETGKKANLYATIGPSDLPGVLLSGHTDVVPVEGQNWTKPPFEMTKSDGKVFGRGTTDMKGFVASAMSIALKAAREDLKTPLHLAFSHDEEIGCVGVRSMIEMLGKAPFRPKFCIVGEPTQMMVATGHKGKTACGWPVAGCACLVRAVAGNHSFCVCGDGHQGGDHLCIMPVVRHRSSGVDPNCCNDSPTR